MITLYGDNLEENKTRIINAVESFSDIFGNRCGIRLFSAPGRTELGGNHTDHQNGHVIAAGINLDIIAVAALNEDGIIRIKSEGYPLDEIELNNLEPIAEEKNASASLIRGIAAAFNSRGYKVSGFNAFTTSNVLKGSGLSSSAAFEVLIGNIINSLFADNKVSDKEIASIGQYAENVYFGKPCGLMDQMASAVGSIVSINFYNINAPEVKRIDYDFAKSGYSLCIINSGGNHADLTEEYASIPAEMKAVAAYFKAENLSRVNPSEFYNNLADIRHVCSDRAILRAAHFFEEDKRALLEAELLENNDFKGFLEQVSISGKSSYMYLQNVCPSGAVQKQPIAIVLLLCERLLNGCGAYRVHGGGFAGTVQAYVPNDMAADFKNTMERFLGKDMCYILKIRSLGGTEIGEF